MNIGDFEVNWKVRWFGKVGVWSFLVLSTVDSGVSFYPLKSPHVERHHQIITPENGPGCMHLNVLI